MLTLSDNAKNIVPNRDFVEDSDAIIRFYVGSNANSNLIKIYTSETTTVSSYSKLIKSPFIVEATTDFTSPSTSQEFLALSCEGVDDYTTKFNASVQIVSTDLDEKYGIENPIKIEEGNLVVGIAEYKIRED